MCTEQLILKLYCSKTKDATLSDYLLGLFEDDHGTQFIDKTDVMLTEEHITIYNRIGHLHFTWDQKSKRVDILQIFIKVEYRKMGLGSLLMKKLEQVVSMHHHSCYQISLYLLTEDKINTFRFYSQLGFIPKTPPDMSHFEMDPLGGIVMIKNISK